MQEHALRHKTMTSVRKLKEQKTSAEGFFQVFVKYRHRIILVSRKISQFMWDTAVLRIGQLASEMRVSIRGQSVGDSNGRSAQRDACPSKNADELTNWDGTKKKGLGW